LFAQQHNWNNLNSDRKIFEAVVLRLVRFGTIVSGKPDQLEVRATQREIAELAQCERATVAKTFRRLVKALILVRTKKDPVTGAFWWALDPSLSNLSLQTIGDPTDFRSADPAPQLNFVDASLEDVEFTKLWSKESLALSQTSDCKYTTEEILRDLQERGALGRVGLRVYQYLLQAEGGTIQQIAQALATDITLVARSLRADGRLRKSKLVMLSDRKYYFANPVSPAYLMETILEPTGKVQRGRRRREQNEIERSEYLVLHIKRWQAKYLAGTYDTFTTEKELKPHHEQPF
jgi:predicted transcriptional regulator